MGVLGGEIKRRQIAAGVKGLLSKTLPKTSNEPTWNPPPLKGFKDWAMFIGMFLVCVALMIWIFSLLDSKF